MTDEKTVPTRPARTAEGETAGADTMNAKGQRDPEGREVSKKQTAPKGSTSSDPDKAAGTRANREAGSEDSDQSIANDGSAAPIKGPEDAEELMKANPGPAAAAARGWDQPGDSGDRFLTNPRFFPDAPPALQPGESREDFQARVKEFEKGQKRSDKEAEKADKAQAKADEQAKKAERSEATSKTGCSASRKSTSKSKSSKK